MLERLVAPWPCERFAPSLTVSVPPPLGAPPPSAQAKGRAFDRIDAWLDGVLRPPLLLSLNPDTCFPLDLSRLFRRTHAMTDEGVETVLRFQESFLPDALLADLEPRIQRAFDTLWRPRVLARWLSAFGLESFPSALARFRVHYRESALRGVLNHIASLANDELTTRVRASWSTGAAPAREEMAPSVLMPVV